MKKKHFPAVVIAILFCFTIYGCDTDLIRSNKLQDVEGWALLTQWGSMSGGKSGPNGLFESYVSQFLSESTWDNIKSYATQDDEDRGSWSDIVADALVINFSQSKIRNIKAKLAQDERVTYMYVNINGYYRWIRIIKL